VEGLRHGHQKSKYDGGLEIRSIRNPLAGPSNGSRLSCGADLSIHNGMLAQRLSRSPLDLLGTGADSFKRMLGRKGASVSHSEQPFVV